jgi:3-oxoacyl-[acyl-carrier-protein] synthase-3
VTAEWITRETGISERRYAAPHEATSDLAAEAAARALDEAGVRARYLSWIVVATSTPDQPQPATAAFVQNRLGATRSACFDVNAVCAGFITALHTGAWLLGTAGPGDGLGLVVGAEVYSRIINPTDRRTAPPRSSATAPGPLSWGRSNRAMACSARAWPRTAAGTT